MKTYQSEFDFEIELVGRYEQHHISFGGTFFSAGWLVGCCNDAHHLAAIFNQNGQAVHSKIGGSHKNDA